MIAMLLALVVVGALLAVIPMDAQIRCVIIVAVVVLLRFLGVV